MTSSPYPRETFDKPGSLHRKARIRFRSPEGPAELVGALKVMASCFRCMADALDVIVRNTESEEDRGDMNVTMPDASQAEQKNARQREWYKREGAERRKKRYEETGT